MTDQSSTDEKAWFEHFGRTSYVAVFEPVEGDSFFGGAPSAHPTGRWPSCGECGEAMAFLMEINLAALPAGVCVVPSPSTLQVFHCVTSMKQFLLDDPRFRMGPDSNYCATHEPFSGCSELRLTDRLGATPAKPADTPGFEPVFIAGWESRADFPSFDEFERLGIDWERSAHNHGPTALRSREQLLPDLVTIQTDPEVLPFDWCVDETKVGGWPVWIQGVDYPTCPQCGEEMTVVLQTRDRLLGEIWGWGMAHISQCPDHPDVFSFQWAK